MLKKDPFHQKVNLLYKSASGGVEHIKIFKVSNVNTALKYLKSKNFWVSAFDISGNKGFHQQIIGKVKMYYFLDLKDLELKQKP